MQGQELVSYGCDKFQNGMYDEALEAFVLAYYKGYEQKWIIETIYSCYMSGNEEEFKNAYDKQSGTAERVVAYEECLLDFIPYRDGEYYIFDKELAVFHGKFSVNELQNTEPDRLFEQLEFSPAALELDWNWNEAKHILVEAKERNIYAICHDMNRAVSFLKIPELGEYMKNVKLFENLQEMQAYFHENTAVYLPKGFYGEQREAFQQMIEQEHQYRLTPEGRNTNNVLLTIGIPTANRGLLVKERLKNLLEMQYDAEIEIAISRNGEDGFKKEYEGISEISDARMIYFDHGRSLAFYINWHYTVEMAHGKYVMLVGDEDDVIQEALEHYLRLLKDYPEVNVLRPKTTFQHMLVDERVYGKKGTDAFGKMFMYQAYLSGLIVRRKDFLEENLLDMGNKLKNAFYGVYPHECWCAMLSQKGDYLEEPVSLILENESYLKEEQKKGKELQVENMPDVFFDKEESGSEIPHYGYYDSRMRQFRGQVEFLHLYMEHDIEAVFIGLHKAIVRTQYFLKMAREWKYRSDEYLKYVDDFLKLCVGVVDEFEFSEKQREALLVEIRNSGIKMLNYHMEITEREANEAKETEE